MSKAIKIALLCFLGIPLIIVLALLSVFLFKDANDFKPAIEEQAKNAAGINVRIDDKLSWSLIPIGLEINKLSIMDQNLAHFASANKIIASIDFWSLFSGEPKVETILLDGLNVHLIQHSDSENNWSNITPKKTDDAASIEVKPEPSPETQKSSDNALNFLVESFQLTNAQVLFESKTQGIDLTIKPFNLILSNITLDQAFPISLSYSLKESKNKLNVDSTLAASLLVSKDLSQLTFSELSNDYVIKAANVSAEDIKVSLASNIFIDTKTENIDISNLLISLNELALNGHAKIQHYSENVNLESALNIPVFSLKALLTGLGLTLPDMQSDNALEKFGLTTNIQLKDDVLSLNGIDIQLDKTNWKGELSHSLKTAASIVRLHGDQITLDDYLPPEAEEATTNTTEESVTERNTDSNPEQALLPIDTLKELNLDIEIQQDLLSIKTIESKQIQLSIKAEKGKIDQTLSGQLFEGSYAVNSSLNVRNKEPLWQSEQRIDKLNLAPLIAGLNIEALKEYGSIAGLLNFKANSQAKGNLISSLKKSAQSQIDFQVDQGAFEGISLNALTCKGFALINKETVDTSAWPQATPFNTLKGSAALKQEKLDLQFDLITTGVHADSKGSVNLAENEINILAALKVIGELGDNACRVNDKVKKIGIPVKCQGVFDTPPAELCKLDTSRLADMAKDLAVEEGKRKLNKEVDRALDKHLGDKKESVKSLLNKFLK